MILVCGATGTIGGQVIRRFAASSIPVRAMVRKRESGKSPFPQSVESVAGDLDRPESLAGALEGIEKVFLLTPNGERQAEQEENMIAAAARIGVTHIVKLSVLGAAPDAASAFGRLHALAEKALQSSGMQWTIVRPNMMMQNLRWYRETMKQGMLPLALGDASVSHVDAEDVGNVVFQALTGQGHAGQTYVVTGPEALTGNQVAAIVSSATGRSISYQALPMDQFRAFLEKNGEPEPVVNAEVELFEAWSKGGGSEVTNTVEAVTGNPAKSLAQYAAEHAAELV